MMTGWPLENMQALCAEANDERNGEFEISDIKQMCNYIYFHEHNKMFFHIKHYTRDLSSEKVFDENRNWSLISSND